MAVIQPTGLGVRLTTKEAASRLGCSVRSLRRYLRDNKIPEKAIYRLPGRLYFWADEIEAIVKGGGIS